MSHPVNDPSVIRAVLTTPATWAVVGLSTNTARTAYRIAEYLDRSLGMRIVPIHPSAPTVFDWPGYAWLADVPDGTRVDVVDCFVNSHLVGAVVDEAIAQRRRLGIGALWLQLGVIDEAAAQRALGAGLEVVMDTCPKIEYPRLRLG
ncbi:MAG: CoA-binding protein [Dermatophilaceae bacterium]